MAPTVKLPSIYSMPRLSSSVNSSPESDSPKTEESSPLRNLKRMDTFTKHPSEPLYNVTEQVVELSPPSSPVTDVPPQRPPPILSSSPVTATFSPDSHARKTTLETRQNMFSRYQPYKKRAGAPPLELRFTARCMGRSSHTEMSLEDVVEGHAILHRGLSHLSDRVLLKALEAKRAFQDCVLYRVGLTKAEIESAERQRDLLNEVLMEVEGKLDNAESQLSLLRQVVDGRGLEEARDDAGYYHAVYADKLVALMIAGAQVEQMELAVKVKQSEGSDAALLLSHSDGDSSDSEPFTGLLSSNDFVE